MEEGEKETVEWRRVIGRGSEEDRVEKKGWRRKRRRRYVNMSLLEVVRSYIN